jgi:hypothetical protein
MHRCGRFQPFAGLYRAIKGTDYPLAHDEQRSSPTSPTLVSAFSGSARAL